MRSMRSHSHPHDTQDKPDDSKIDWSVFKQVIPYLMEYKARVGLALACLVGAKLASVGMPFVLKQIVDDLDSQLSDDTLAFISVPLGFLLAYGFIRLLNVLLGEVRDTLFGRVTERAMRRIGLRVFQHLHALDLNFHLNRKTGGLSRDIERGTNGISFIMRFMVFNIVPTFLELLLVMAILWQQYRIEFALIVLVSVITYVWFSKTTTDWRTQFIRKANEADNRSNTRAVDSLLNYETVKYFANESHEADIYDRELARWERARRQNRLTLFALNGGQALIITLSMTAMLTLAAYEVSEGIMTIGDFVLVNAFLMQIFMPLNFLGFVYREIKGSMTNIERMLGLLKVSPAVKDVPDATALKVTGGTIEFRNLSFSYDPERPILQNLSFTVAAGEKVALVGSSGSGKSTIAKLLFRFYDPTQGDIFIDQQNVREVSQHSLRSAIGVVPQETVLFDDTLLENVRYGRPSANDDEVKSAISMAHLDTFIKHAPKGYATVVGERGLKLSGGEKQRVAIARTLLKAPSILIFDEATSALDSESEQAVTSAMTDVCSGKTSLVIAHRLSTIIDADRILVIDQGRLVEQGNHYELLAKQGHYAKLWHLQHQSQDMSPAS